MTVPRSGLRGSHRSSGVTPSGLACLIAVCLSTGCHNTTEAGTLLVTSAFSDEILVFDALTGEHTSAISMDPRIDEVDEPHGIAVAPDGLHWYAALSHGVPTLWKYESRDQRLVGRVELPQTGAGRIGITPDGTTAFVPDYFRGSPGVASTVAVVDLGSMSVRDTVVVCDAPHDAVPSRSGTLVAITCSMGDEIVILDAHTYQEVLRFPVGSTESGKAKPMNVIWSSDDSLLYVTLMGHSQVEVLESKTGTPVGQIDVGAGPAQLAITRDGTLLAVANRLSATVSLVDPVALTERRRVRLDAQNPHGITFDTKGEGIYITYEGTTGQPGGVVALDRSGDLRWQTPGGTLTLGIAFLPEEPEARS